MNKVIVAACVAVAFFLGWAAPLFADEVTSLREWDAETQKIAIIVATTTEAFRSRRVGDLLRESCILELLGARPHNTYNIEDRYLKQVMYVSPDKSAEDPASNAALSLRILCPTAPPSEAKIDDKLPSTKIVYWTLGSLIGTLHTKSQQFKVMWFALQLQMFRTYIDENPTLAKVDKLPPYSECIFNKLTSVIQESKSIHVPPALMTTWEILIDPKYQDDLVEDFFIKEIALQCGKEALSPRAIAHKDPQP